MKRILLCLIMVQGIFILNRQSLHSRYAEDILWEEIPVVLSVSKRTQPVIEAPASSYIITAEDIEKRGYTNLKEIFKDLPGMESIEYYFSELGTEVPVRGITGNNKIIFMINGMRVNPPGGEGMPLRSDFNITNARQIEIGYGPGSTLYGQDAISAIVNVVTEEDQEGLDAGIEGGLNNHQAAYISGVKHFEDFTASGNISFTDRELIDLKDQYQDWWAQYTPAQDYD
ncbi:MAG: TonB-dependent receptor plug domain-containing protein, partial [Elusimicrobiota bacterium]